MTDLDTPAPLGTQPSEPDQTPGALSPRELGRWAWRQLTSMRTALVLLMMLGLASIPGSVIPQQRVDPNAVANWQLAHPSLTPLYIKLGMFHVYSSAWFSAIYLLLMVSLIGCILPRIRVYWRATVAPPPRVPRNLLRLPASSSTTSPSDPREVVETARRLLRRSRYRIVVSHDPQAGVSTMSAQRGYLREAGNLLFHLSLVVVLVSFAAGDLFGYRGAVSLVEGQTFTNTQEAYDDYYPGRFFDASRLAPFDLKLNDFKVNFLTSGPQLGQPTSFRADLAYHPSPSQPARSKRLEVNHPLTIGGTSIFLVGNGYAPVVTVRDGTGEIVYSGPTVFLPTSTTYAEWGVIKAADASPTQLGFEGQFLPTYGYNKAVGAFSQFPDALAPALSLTAYTGDLGLGSGIPQSVLKLDKTRLTQMRDKSGKPLTLTIGLGQTRRLPGGVGSIRFDGVRRYARLQLSSVPASTVALGGVMLGLIGLLGSLYVRPRRIWVRAHRTHSSDDSGEPTTLVEIAGLEQRERKGLDIAVRDLLDEIKKAAT